MDSSDEMIKFADGFFVGNLGITVCMFDGLLSRFRWESITSLWSAPSVTLPEKRDHDDGAMSSVSFGSLWSCRSICSGSGDLHPHYRLSWASFKHLQPFSYGCQCCRQRYKIPRRKSSHLHLCLQSRSFCPQSAAVECLWGCCLPSFSKLGITLH